MLEVDLMAMSITIVVFLLLIYFLNISLYRPVLAFMDKREEMIKKDEEDAKNNLFGIDEDKAEIEQILAKARKEANDIKQAAIEKAKENANKVVAEEKSKLQDKFDVFMKDLEKEKDKIKKDLISNIPSFKDSLKNTLAKI